jgi:hypothetical protein
MFAFACVAAYGCGPTLGVRGRLAEQARTDMRCEEVNRVLQLTDYAFEVRGCGVIAEYGDSGMGSERVFHRITPAATIAAAETQCGLDDLQSIEERFPTRRTFVGCGSTVSYDLMCAEGVGCHWERDGEMARSVIAPVVLPTAPPPITPTPTDATEVVPPPPGAS